MRWFCMRVFYSSLTLLYTKITYTGSINDPWLMWMLSIHFPRVMSSVPGVFHKIVRQKQTLFWVRTVSIFCVFIPLHIFYLMWKYSKIGLLFSSIHFKYRSRSQKYFDILILIWVWKFSATASWCTISTVAATSQKNDIRRNITSRD